LTRKDSKDK